MKVYELWAKWAQDLIRQVWFGRLVLGVILFSGIVLGLETNSELMSRFGHAFRIVDRIIVGFFLVEVFLKIVAEGRRPFSYFKDGWNLIDFIIVISCLLPSGSNALAVFRMIRVLRIFRLVTALPQLQIIISALITSIPSMFYVMVLLAMHFYMFSVFGNFLFSQNDPVHFGTLGRSLLTLFQVLTLEGWVDVMRIQIYGCSQFGYEGFANLCQRSSAQPIWAILYFISFIVMGTMFILNLLIGALVNGMSEAQKEFQKKSEDTDVVVALKDLSEQIRVLQAKT